MNNSSKKHEPEKPQVTNFIAKTAAIGKNVKIWHSAYVGAETTIGDNVMIGSLTHFNHKVSIGSNTRIEGSVYIPPLVVGNNVFIGPGATFTNDPMSPNMSGVVVDDGAAL